MGYWRGSDSWELSVTFGSESWTTRGPPQSQLYLSVTVTEEQLDTRREPLAAPAPAWSCSSALLSTPQQFGLGLYDGNLWSHQSIGRLG